MTSKFLNISTDTTLGGSSASDNTVASQKAVKAYADTKQDTITSSNKLSASLVSGLATVATTGSYNDLSNKPTIPTVNNATLTIQKNGSNVATFTANASSNVTANISVPNVTSTYTATGTDAVNGMAVSNAIATKQDNLVSGTNIKTINGNSLLGSGNITIETSSTPNVDGETISYNSSDALQAIAVKNVRDGSTLPIWHGTEYQWNHGDPTTWYYWQTSATALWTSGGTLPGTTNWFIAYGNGRFVVVPIYSGTTAYSTDGGETWQSGGAITISEVNDIIFANNRFVCLSTYGSIKYSTDGGETWQSGGNLPSQSSGFWNNITYGDSKFVAVHSTGIIYYSTDNCATWVVGSSLPNKGQYNNWRIAYGDGDFVAVCSQTTTAATSVNLIDWSFSDLPSSIPWGKIAYGNGRFVVICNSRIKTAYSTDGGETWQSGGALGHSASLYDITYGNNMFVAIIGSYSEISTDGGETWQSIITPSGSKKTIAYGNNKFVAVAYNGDGADIFSVTYDKCYTDTANPTTTSVVYSEPETASSYTISSVTSGAITLSNNNTYYYNQSGNVQTYQTIGDAHPEYLCFIDGVGVKIGNTTIATNNSNNS